MGRAGGAALRWGAELPVLGAPMAGGVSTPALVSAVSSAGGLGLLAGGYRTAAGLGAQIAAVRAAGVAFGVNLFAPNPLPVDPAAFAAYRAEITADAVGLGVELPSDPVEDDDDWPAKIDLLLTDPVPVVSLTFGLPDGRVVAGLRRRGTAVLITVTSPDEARAAAALGPDGLVVQSSAAGGHHASFDPRRAPAPVPLTELVAGVRAACELPVVAAGGIATARSAAAALGAGAVAVAVGTALLRTPESGATPLHRAALADPSRTGTVLTRAFTGRPARALRNGFIDAHGAHAPLGYPALHHLTAPLRRAAAAAGDAERVHLWAGAAFAHAAEVPAAAVVGELGRLL